MFRKFASFVALLAAALLQAGCAGADEALFPTPTPAPARMGALTPYQTPSVVLPTHTPAAETPTTEVPPTPTPRAHTVQRGEDLSGLALRYGVPLEELLTANPTINPRMMSVGAVLVIPAPKTPIAPTAGTPGLQTPTALPLQARPVTCWRASDSGIWCFQEVRHGGATALEGVAAIFTLRGDTAQPALTHEALLPLDLLPPGQALPLYAYFPPQVATSLEGNLRAESQIIRALPNPDDGRYLPGEVRATRVKISADGLSAEITADVRLRAPAGQASRVWVAAAAYNADGEVVGVRRWENPQGSAITAGAALQARFSIYSAAGQIERVELVAEIRP
jgi:LysM repeat protein